MPQNFILTSSLSPFNAKSSNIKSSLTKGISSEKLLGITTDSNFTIEKHLNELCRKSSLKLHVLTRCAKLMSTEKRYLIISRIPQFDYFQLVWKIHTKNQTIESTVCTKRR